MEFNPSNPVIKLCLQGMAMEDQGKPDEASKLFLQAWDESTDDFEKYIAAYFAFMCRFLRIRPVPVARQDHLRT